jgi:hypothetical protein
MSTWQATKGLSLASHGRSMKAFYYREGRFRKWGRNVGQPPRKYRGNTDGHFSSRKCSPWRWGMLAWGGVKLPSLRVECSFVASCASSWRPRSGRINTRSRRSYSSPSGRWHAPFKLASRTHGAQRSARRHSASRGRAPNGSYGRVVLGSLRGVTNDHIEGVQRASR